MNRRLGFDDYKRAFWRDLSAGVVVFLVAVPLCLGIAQGSGASALSGLITGIVAGLLVAWLSGSHTSVSGPAAGLTAVVFSLQNELGGFEALLVAVILAGILQLIMGALKAGSLAAFFPSSVIKGLLAGIGITVILMQFPHLLGHELGFESETDKGEKFAAIYHAFTSRPHFGALGIGILALILLMLWDKTPMQKFPLFPAPLVVVVLSVSAVWFFKVIDPLDPAEAFYLIDIPKDKTLWRALESPDWKILSNPAVYVSAIVLALVASIETLMCIEAVDKIDPKQRTTPPDRELLAQGVGNVASGMLGGLPMTSVIIRSSANVNAGAETRIAAFIHGLLLLIFVVFAQKLLNLIPLSCLAAILVGIGFKLASPQVFRQMWREGAVQFVPFATTIGAIIMTDLLKGVLVGMGVSICFILRSNLSQPVRRIMEKHVGDDVLRVELANQVSFLNRATIMNTLNEIPRGSHVVIDAQKTIYIDTDVLDLLSDFEQVTAPAHDLKISLTGFKDHYRLQNRIQYVDVSTRDVQAEVTPESVLELLRAGNERFVNGEPVARDPRRQIGATSEGQYPLAVVLACMDSRIATEMLFDLGLGDIFSVRVAGNVVAEKELGSIEYGCAVAGAKALVVMGHTRCGAVNASIDFVAQSADPKKATGCEHIGSITDHIARVIQTEKTFRENRVSSNEAFSLRITELNVRQTIRETLSRSRALRGLVEAGKVIAVGAIYDVRSGKVNFLESTSQDFHSKNKSNWA